MIDSQNSNGPALFPSTCFEPSCGRIVGTLAFDASSHSFFANHEIMIKRRMRSISDSDMFNAIDASTTICSADMPCLPRRKPEELIIGVASVAEFPPPAQIKRTVGDISKLQRSPQLSRLRRQKDMHGQESH
jgi:hypothetical protein